MLGTTKSLSGSLFSSRQCPSAWPGIRYLHGIAPTSLPILSTVFQKLKTLSIVRYVLISEMLKREKKMGILKSI